MAEEAAPQEEHPLVRAFQPRKRILWYGDSPTASTGFGTVSRHLCRALYRTGLYEIDILGINYFGDFYDRADFPYQIVPAKLGDPNDPHGRRMLLDILSRSKVYDAIFILNDSYVIKGIAGELRKFIKEQGLPTKVIYYFPVDCCVQPESADAFYSPDVLVAFTEFAKEEALKTFSDLKDIRVIYHGVDPEAYRPLAEESRNLYRRQYFGIEDPGTKLFINVNRNSPRKNLAQTVLAFSEYFRQHPDSRLYLHTPIRDMMLDLEPAIRGCGLEVNREVLFPQNYSPAHGVPDSVVNQIYNAADCFLNTTTGEGFGLSVPESMAAGCPVIVPDNTSMPEIVGDDGDRGIVYPTKELFYIDNSGLRKIGRLGDITAAVDRLFSMSEDERLVMTTRARAWCLEHSWKKKGEQWAELLREVLAEGSKIGGQDRAVTEDI